MSAGKKELRLRIFAGPNGSGKSLIVNEVRNTTVHGSPLDLGIYINADEIADALTASTFTFSSYQVSVTKNPLLAFAESSGLLDHEFTFHQLKNSISIYQRHVRIKSKIDIDKLAQLIARYLREALLRTGKRFSFETVFSHDSNIDFMRKAQAAGYKAYLYYVATEDPEINKFRVQVRVLNGGHPVPEERIAPRYYRSLGLLYEAAEYAYQAYFFDNTHDAPRLVNHFKVKDGHKEWDTRHPNEFPYWFKKYYWEKSK